MTYQELCYIQETLIGRQNLSTIDLKDVYGLTGIKFDKTDPRFIKFDEWLSLDDVETILSTGFCDSCAFDNVTYNKEEYAFAKEALLDAGVDKERLTLELIQAKMLSMGFSLVLHDEDGTKLLRKGDISKTLQIKIDEAEVGPYMVIEELLEGDFYDVEAFIQECVYGEVIYG